MERAMVGTRSTSASIAHRYPGLGDGLITGSTGCGLRAEDAARGRDQKLVQGLRAENAQLKDSNLTLKVQNQDLSQRAVDDSQAIRALETANAQYERSIAGYQDDRERMRAAFNDLKDRVRAATTR